jgi:hypothetical protein
MKADQKALSYIESQKNVKKSVRKIDKTHCENFMKYAYQRKDANKLNNNDSTWKHKPKKYLK